MGNVIIFGGARMTAPVGSSTFPEKPNEYELLETITESTTFIAPETGYYKIEDFGASGNGGSYSIYVLEEWDYEYQENAYTTASYFNAGCGGGGGGGGYASSIVKLNKGDLVLIEIGAVGSDTIVTINSTTNEAYEVMKVTSGANGGSATATDNTASAGSGGAGGVASGGNVSNVNGGAGGNGTAASNIYSNGFSLDKTITQGVGGSAGYTDGNTGGVGGTPVNNKKAGSGSAGFVRISTGNTNAA